MFKQRFSFKSFYIISIILFSTSLFSCKNFLNAGAVSQEIKDTIEYNNAKTIEITISCKEDQGTIYPQQSYKAKLGYDFEIQFIPNTDNYVIKNPEEIFEAVNKFDPSESRADYIQFTNLERSIEDVKAGLYRIKAKVIKDANDIMIRPCLTTLPAVVDIYPPFVPSGYAQDTTIKITFSKPMNPDSFGNFECISITSDDKNLKNCFEKPYFSNNFTILNIPASKENRVLNTDNEATCQITITINSENIIDNENLHLSKNTVYTYCVNQGIDNKAPFILSGDVFSIKNDKLSNLDFDSWSNSTSVFYQNHIRDTFYYSFDGYDNESGIGGIRITETLWQYTNGTHASDASPISYDTGTIIHKSDSEDYAVYNISGEYKIQNLHDGIIRLDFQILDKANNTSSAITYYVIKDTSIDINTLKFSEFNEVQKYESEYSSDTRTLTFIETPKDKFYKDYYSEYEITAKWGYQQDSITKTLELDGLAYTLEHNPNVITYMEIFCKDSVGNEKTISRAIPPRAFYDSSCLSRVGNTYKITNIPFNYETLNAIALFCGAQLKIYNYYFTYKTSANSIISEDITPNNDDNTISIIPLPNNSNTPEKKQFYPIYVFEYSDGSFWYSSLNPSYYVIYDKGSGQQPSMTFTSGYSTTQMSQAPEIPESLTISSTPITNSGCCEVTIKTELDNNFTWSYIFKNKETNKKSSFYSNTFYLSTPATYTLSLEARDSEGNIYTKANQKIQFENQVPISELALAYDTTPPTFDIYNSKKYRIEPNGVAIVTLPEDKNGLYTNPQNSKTGELTYYLFPNYGSTLSEFQYYSLEELETHVDKAKTMKYDTSLPYIFIPIEEEGYYTLCLVVADKANNSSVECIPVFKKISNNFYFSEKKEKSSISSSSGSTAIHLVTTTYNENESERSKYLLKVKYDNSKKIWDDSIYKNENGNTGVTTETSLGEINASENNNIWVKCLHFGAYNQQTPIKDIGFYSTSYYYLSSASTGTKFENIIPGETGLQFFISGPVLVHTYYSQKKLTETNSQEAIMIWLNNGIETGIVTDTANFCYGNEKFEEIPEGYYYTTIVHLANGNSVMTKVKQK